MGVSVVKELILSPQTHIMVSVELHQFILAALHNKKNLMIPAMLYPEAWSTTMSPCSRVSSFDATSQNMLPALLGHQVSGIATDGVSQNQGQDNASIYSTVHVSYGSYDIEDAAEAPAGVCPRYQAQINHYLEH